MINWLLCPNLPTYPTLPYLTLPYPTLYPTLPYPTLPYPTLPHPTLPCPPLPSPPLTLPTLPCPTLPYPTLPYLPYPTLPYPTLPCPALPYPTLPYPTLPYPTLPYPTLPYPTLPYPTLPYPTLPYPTLPTYPPAHLPTHPPTYLVSHHLSASSRSWMEVEGPRRLRSHQRLAHTWASAGAMTQAVGVNWTEWPSTLGRIPKTNNLMMALLSRSDHFSPFRHFVSLRFQSCKTFICLFRTSISSILWLMIVPQLCSCATRGTRCQRLGAKGKGEAPANWLLGRCQEQLVAAARAGFLKFLDAKRRRAANPVNERYWIGDFQLKVRCCCLAYTWPTGTVPDASATRRKGRRSHDCVAAQDFIALCHCLKCLEASWACCFNVFKF